MRTGGGGGGGILFDIDEGIGGDGGGGGGGTLLVSVKEAAEANSVTSKLSGSKIGGSGSKRSLDALGGVTGGVVLVVLVLSLVLSIVSDDFVSIFCLGIGNGLVECRDGLN
jgi:hypothetical protein